MEKAIFMPEPEVFLREEYIDDINHIVNDFLKNGYEISAVDASSAWSYYSDSYAAGWLMIYDKTDTFDILKDLFILEKNNSRIY